MLARNAGPAPRGVAARRLAPAALLGLAASAFIALALLGRIPAEMLGTPAPWIKLAYGGALAAAAAWLTARLSRPVARLQAPRLTVLAVMATMAAVGLASALAEPPGARLDTLWGHSWSACPWAVLALSLPALAATLWAARGLAPTRLRAAGFAAGLLAGSLGALGYALSCTEPAPLFVAVWYSAGIVLVGLLGAWLGPRVLRW